MASINTNINCPITYIKSICNKRVTIYILNILDDKVFIAVPIKTNAVKVLAVYISPSYNSKCVLGDNFYVYSELQIMFQCTKEITVY